MDNKINVDLLGYGICANAGDVLIFEAMKSLFKDDIVFRQKHVRTDKLEDVSDKIVIGPGGILSGSYKPDECPDEWLVKYLDEVKVDEWVKANKKIFFFGTGTNTPHRPNNNEKPFSNYSSNIIRKLIKQSSKVYLRGSYDISSIQKLVDSDDIGKFKFQACPSLFIRNFAKNERLKSDKVAINLPFTSFLNEKNYKTHPINKLINYIRSQGLVPELIPNHPQDINKYTLELFENISLSEKVIKCIENSDTKILPRLMRSDFEKSECIFSRYSGYRFALGSRLHSFLPFLAFDTPTIFLTPNTGRMSMPYDYFKSAYFLSKYQYSIQFAEKMIDACIERLQFFIENEEGLIRHIRQNRDLLWRDTLDNKNEVLETFAKMI